MPDLQAWTLTRHACERAEELGFTHDEVVKACTLPEIAYPGDARQGGGRFVHLWRDLALVTNPQEGRVITVMLRRHDSWAHGRDIRRSA